MRQLVFILLCGIGMIGCSDPLSPYTAGSNVVRFSMAFQSINDFPTSIGLLTIYAFKENEKGKYVFYRKLAELNRDAIRQLETAPSPGENYTESRLFPAELTVGNYRLYVVGNGQVEGVESLQVGVSEPFDLYFTYPENGLYWAYFLGEAEVNAENDNPVVQIELHRVVSRVFLKLYSVPYQIDIVRMSIKNMVSRIHLNGMYSGITHSRQEIFKMKNESVYLQDTILFDLYTFPSAQDSSRLELIFQAKNGQERTKWIPLQLEPDRYLYLTGEVNSACGALVSFEFSCVYFFVWDWRNIVLPEFPLKPLPR